MGGGDLNLKKSWHPSTMKNMEKVWKAEQKHDQEKRRIAELQREIREEKAREDIQKFAEDKGVLEKKDDMKLDWMYKGPGGAVDREEYLLGRAIDKSFELLEKSEKGSASSSSTARNNIDTCVPTSIFSGGNEQVDLARKLQEDPLFAIRKKEIESRSQILKNPVKLKQLRELIKEQKSKKQKKHKKDKKKKKDRKRKASSSDESSDDELDAVLLAKYKKLKDKLTSTDIVKLKSEQSNSSESEEEEEEERKTKNSVSVQNSSHRKRKYERNYSNDDDSDDQRRVHKSYGLLKPPDSKPQQLPHRTSIRKSRSRSPPKSKEVVKPRWVRPEKKKLSEDEIERRRQEMMANASWREKERERNVARYREEEKKEKKHDNEFNEDFMRKQLSHAAAQSSVERRIKSNIYNIQRSAVSMDKNFARR
ncbi:pre-mRNA-splicing factor CWC25 homolog [Anabrus simplex]|uniref:pre-mRNA-splicing factor CWC25 homolog n=1 Tax=Anabrus simplex TaxID=316456 RepID=UPI0034DD23A4